MVYGITGNTQKEELWSPVADLVAWLQDHKLAFHLKRDIAAGLIDRALLDPATCDAHASDDLSDDSDVILSFGGDGTMLMSAHEVGTRGTPILGVNIGRLGFLADIEVGQLHTAIECIERGEYVVESRMVLGVRINNGLDDRTYWALNEFVLERSGSAGLLMLRVDVDGVHLNDYWADGLIVSTPTGSTAYSLSVGGPIVMPGSNVMILTPLAPHSLTVRPIVIPDNCVLEARVIDHRQPFVLAADGRSIPFQGTKHSFTISRGEHTVNLVKLPEQHYFQTIRSKLMWGVMRHN